MKNDTQIPFVPVEKNNHKLFVQGNSFVLTVPSGFAKSAEVLKDRRIRSYTLKGSAVIYEYEKMCHNTEYDLLSVAFDCLFAVWHITDKTGVREYIEKAVENLIVVQEHFNNDEDKDVI